MLMLSVWGLPLEYCLSVQNKKNKNSISGNGNSIFQYIPMCGLGLYSLQSIIAFHPHNFFINGQVRR